MILEQHQFYEMTSGALIGGELEGNNPVRARLLEWLRSREAIAFVGAGASIESYRSWSDLLTFLGEKAASEGLANDDDLEFWKLEQLHRPQQVARMIRERFGENAIFSEILQDYFAEKKSRRTGEFYTEIQQLVAMLPFKGIVTTNYDPGLLNALMAHRPHDRSRSTATWRDEEIVYSWYTKEIFRNKNHCPLLHVHGFWDRPSTIILDNDKYREVYGREYFRNMFRSLWSQERLVLVGCGFTDTWLDRNLDEIIGQMAETVGVRHFAFVGVTEKQERHISRYRNLMRNMYRIEIIFYRIKSVFENNEEKLDHSELLTELNDISIEINPKKETIVEKIATQNAADKYDVLSSFSLINRNL